MMSSRERLLAAMQRQPVDRVPLHVRGVRAWDEEWVASRDPSYQPLIAAAAAHADYVETWAPSYGLFYTATPVPTESWTEDRDDWIAHFTRYETPAGPLRAMYLQSKRGLPGMQREFPVKGLADMERVLSVPYVPGQPDCRGFFDKVAQLGERGLVMCAIPNAISLLHQLMGSELLALYSITERARVLEWLWLFHDRCKALLAYLLSQGVGPCFAMSGEEYATPPLHSPHDFREFVVEPERELAAMIHRAGGLLHIHCHGPLNAVLEDFLTLGADCLHPLEAPPLGDVELADAKQRIGEQICLEGNIQIGDLYAGDAAAIAAQVRYNIRVTGGRGYIVCPTASPHTAVLSERTVQNYLAMIEAAVEAGKCA